VDHPERLPGRGGRPFFRRVVHLRRERPAQEPALVTGIGYPVEGSVEPGGGRYRRLDLLEEREVQSTGQLRKEDPGCFGELGGARGDPRAVEGAGVGATWRRPVPAFEASDVMVT
jgi:hypothetical protein